jgi:hypothetical protein
MSTPKYKIYPSILDKFQKFLDSDLVAEEFWNKKDDEYVLTPDEMSAQLEQELLDCINRVPHGPSEAADKGTAFNEVIDCVIENHPCEREDMEIFSSNSFRVLDVYGNPNDPETCDVEHHDECKPNIHVKFNGWDFYFDSFLCKNVARYFRGCIPQYTCSAILPTIYGDVELYGHVDYINTNKVNDLKTTKNYTFGNYAKYWQRHLYPYCLIESGEMEEVTEFEFTVVKWKERKNEPISGEMYKEAYTYSHEASSKALRGICESFIEWLEANREKITDKKIFGGENDEVPCD